MADKLIVNLDRSNTISSEMSVFINNANSPQQVEFSIIQNNILTSTAQQTNAAITPLQNRLTTVESEVSQIKPTVATLNTDMTGVKSSISTIQANVNSLNADVGTLKTDMTQAKSDISVLQTKIEDSVSEKYTTKPTAVKIIQGAKVSIGSSYTLTLSWTNQSKMPSRVMVYFSSLDFSTNLINIDGSLGNNVRDGNFCSVELMLRPGTTSVFDAYVNSYYWGATSNNRYMKTFARTFIPNCSSSSYPCFEGDVDYNTTSKTHNADGNIGVFAGYAFVTDGMGNGYANAIGGIKVDSFKYTTSGFSCIYRNLGGIREDTHTLDMSMYAFVFQ